MSEKREDTENYDLIVVGGGAAGFFGAICCAENAPGLRIAILEKSNKLLSKVRVSGGGRCNVTHHCFNPFKLANHYPRGERQLKSVFRKFDASAMVEWLTQKGVATKVEADGRMFPASNSSQTIIDCFLKQAQTHQISIKPGTSVQSIKKEFDLFYVHTNNSIFSARAVLIASGGNPSRASYDFIRSIGHAILDPIPSLFTFNDSQKRLTELMGVSVSDGEVRIQGTKLRERGPILLTHWGLSGPAVIRLSAWAAEYLHSRSYNFTAVVNWTTFEREEQLREALAAHRASHQKQKLYSAAPFRLPARLWEKLALLSGISEEKPWSEASQKSINKLVENLYRFEFKISGKTTFKEEFVTCGGVDTKEVNPETMESNIRPGLFFAGEVLNVDGETGGFNFQAAWSTAYVAAAKIADYLCKNAL